MEPDRHVPIHLRSKHRVKFAFYFYWMAPGHSKANSWHEIISLWQVRLIILRWAIPDVLYRIRNIQDVKLQSNTTGSVYIAKESLHSLSQQQQQQQQQQQAM